MRMASDVAIRNLLECDAQFLFGVGRNQRRFPAKSGQHCDWPLHELGREQRQAVQPPIGISLFTVELGPKRFSTGTSLRSSRGSSSGDATGPALHQAPDVSSCNKMRARDGAQSTHSAWQAGRETYPGADCFRTFPENNTFRVALGVLPDT